MEVQSNPNKCAEFVIVLLQARTQAHIYHFQTRKFSAHIALNEFYDGILELTDSFVESYQGCYGIIRNYPMQAPIKEDDQPLKYMESLCSYINSNRSMFDESYLQNQIDEMVTLIEKTKYKLRELVD